MSTKTVHVITSTTGNGWAVRRRGAERATKTFRSQEDAVKFARSVAKKNGTDLFIHRPNGTVKQYDSYSVASAE